MRRPSLLSDTLLRDLMAAGQADVLVALPTLDNAGTVGPVVHAVAEAFSTTLLRERTVLLNADGGSSDGTCEQVRRSAAGQGELVVAAHPLRTLHRISTPYHGVPGRGGALRLVFAAAELLRVRVVVVVDPEAPSLTAAEVARLVEPVLRQGYDFVKPVLPRSPWEGPLVTQLVRPLLRAAWGRRLLEPVEPQFSCSGAFASQALAQAEWTDPEGQHGLDVALAALALGGRSRVAQVPVVARAAPGGARRPPLAEVFQQVVGTAFRVLERAQEAWPQVEGSEPLPVLGTPFAASEECPAFDTQALWRSFVEALPALQALLAEVLGADTLGALLEACEQPAPGLGGALWVRVVYEFLAASHHRAMGLGQLMQALLPLYEGRVATFLWETQALTAEAAHARLEELALAFEKGKPELLARWRSR